ncbi:hypothetical protein BN1007_180073 [Klebsiella variicola]|nr:hypothetical protein BN1007_180073 [Klebsiella variicola]CTQ12368.1 hypothetical protein BN1200_1590018 [Klebsiella variicola]
MYFIFSIITYGWFVFRFRPSHQSSLFFRLLKSIYVYKINQLEILPLGLGLLKSTVVYQHLPTNDGITVGSFGSIEIDTNTGSGIYGSY